MLRYVEDDVHLRVHWVEAGVPDASQFDDRQVILVDQDGGVGWTWGEAFRQLREAGEPTPMIVGFVDLPWQVVSSPNAEDKVQAILHAFGILIPGGTE